MSGNLRWLFRLIKVYAAALHSSNRCLPTISTFLPPTEVVDASINHQLHLSSATLTPPRAPMNGTLSHNSTPALLLTVAVRQSGLRRTVSRGRQIVVGALCHALANKLPDGSTSSAATPVHCSLRLPFTPSTTITSATHRLAITVHRQRYSSPD